MEFFWVTDWLLAFILAFLPFCSLQCSSPYNHIYPPTSPFPENYQLASKWNQAVESAIASNCQVHLLPFSMYTSDFGSYIIKKCFNLLLFMTVQNLTMLSNFFLCWLAACRWPYRGTPWRLNHFIVITLYQQQPNG